MSNSTRDTRFLIRMTSYILEFLDKMSRRNFWTNPEDEKTAKCHYSHSETGWGNFHTTEPCSMHTEKFQRWLDCGFIKCTATECTVDPRGSCGSRNYPITMTNDASGRITDISVGHDEVFYRQDYKIRYAEDVNISSADH